MNRRSSGRSQAHRTSPGIGISRQASGFLSLDLGVSVDPTSAPAGTVRTVSAALTGDWLNSVGDAISAYVIADSVRVRSWTVDFGDGTVRTYPADATLPDRLLVAHAYGAGGFDVTVTAHVTGDAYGAFFTPAGIPFEQVVPFAIDISNSASGIAGLPLAEDTPGSGAVYEINDRNALDVRVLTVEEAAFLDGLGLLRR